MLFYGDDWRGGTYEIPSKWRGAYLDLCWCIFDQGGEVANNAEALANMARLTPRQFEVAWPVLRRKFLVSDDIVRHKKIDALLAAYDKKVTKLQQNGSKGGRKTQQKQRAAQANAEVTQSKGLGPATYVAEDPIPTGPEKQKVLSTLSADAVAVFRAIAREATLRPAVSLRDVDRLRESVLALEGRTFIAGPHGVAAEAFRAICQEAEKHGYEIRVEDQPRLRLIAND